MNPAHTVFIAGERCYLRPLVRDDLAGNWQRWFNDAEVTRHLYRGVFPTTTEGLAAFYEEVVQSQNDLVLGICASSDEVHVGNVGLHRIDWVNRSAEFGIVIGEREYWGRGIGAEATRLIVQHGFRRLNLNRIWLGVFADHTAASDMYRKVGFRDEGRLREAVLREGAAQDTLVMSILASELSGAGA